jgi:hypothetical protein
MSNMESTSLAPGMSPRQNPLSEEQFAGYVRKQSISSRESLDAGLTIKTREGDIVTLQSNTYSEFNSFAYDSKGVLENGSGTAMTTQSIREITLRSGESFSFSVQGDLSEEELKDIEAIVKGIDEVISEVAQGDMDDAIAKALSMGGYDTVSEYSADISYQKSYTMRSQVQEQVINAIPEAYRQPEKSIPETSFKDLFTKDKSMIDFERLLEKILEELEKHEEKLVGKAQKPIDKLFRHHLHGLKNDEGEKSPVFLAIESARKQIEAGIEKMMEKMAKGMFEDHFSAFS